MRPSTLKGSCLCGGIRYEINRPLGAVVNARLRPGTLLPLDARRGAPHALRIVARERPHLLPRVRLDALGTTDDDPGTRPEAHVYVGAKAPRPEITDALPQHDTHLDAPL